MSRRSTTLQPSHARISHDAVARISHSSPIPSFVGSTEVGTVSEAASAFVRRAKAVLAGERSRAILKWGKRLGLTGLLASGLQQAAMATMPRTVDAAYNPVAEWTGFHVAYEGVTQEPTEAPANQGNVARRAKYAYEMRLSELDTNGAIFGRFRGDSFTPGGEKDPRWWTVRGHSDGTRTELYYTDEEGKILGHIELTKYADSIWAGHLTGLDRSISDKGSVQSPIIVTGSYFVPRAQNDKFLDEPSVYIPAYDQ
jgi:hypothetical protein